MRDLAQTPAFISLELPEFCSLLLSYNTLELDAERGTSTYSTLIWHSANIQYLVTYLLHVLYIWLNAHLMLLLISSN